MTGGVITPPRPAVSPPLGEGNGAGQQCASGAFDGRENQAAAVRQFVRDMLGGHPALDELVLIASELAANAVRHTRSGLPGGRFHLHLAWDEWQVVVVVCDQGSGTAPAAHDPGPGAESSRGLMLVAGLLEEMGGKLEWHGDGRGRSVMAVWLAP